MVYLLLFQFKVPAKFQRIIIGLRGQNLKRVESKTGVFNIKIVPGPSEVHCVLQDCCSFQLQCLYYSTYGAVKYSNDLHNYH